MTEVSEDKALERELERHLSMRKYVYLLIHPSFLSAWPMEIKDLAVGEPVMLGAEQFKTAVYTQKKNPW